MNIHEANVQVHSRYLHNPIHNNLYDFVQPIISIYKLEGFSPCLSHIYAAIEGGQVQYKSLRFKFEIVPLLVLIYVWQQKYSIMQKYWFIGPNPHIHFNPI